MSTDGPTGLGPRFRRLWAASASSNLADGIIGIAVTLATAQITSSAAAVAALRVARSVPDALAALPAGAIADRVDRRLLMIAGNTVRAGVLALLAAAAWLDALSLPAMYVAIALLGLVEVQVDTAAQSVVPSVVGRERLGAANGRLYGTQVAMNEFVGAPLGGLLVAAATAAAFGVSAGLYVLAAALFLLLPGRYRAERRERTSMYADVGEGVRVLLSSTVLRTLAVMTGVLNLANTAFFAVFVLYAVGSDSAMGLSEAAYGVLFATLAVGAVSGSAVGEVLERRLHRVNLLRIGVVGVTGTFVVPAVTTDVFAVGAAFFVSGLTVMVYRVAMVSLRQLLTPDALLGRVNASYRVIALASVPLGAVIGGLVGDLVGLRAVFVTSAVLSAVTLLGFAVITPRALAEEEARAQAAG